MDRRYNVEQVVQFTRTPAYAFLVEDLKQKMFEKFKYTLDKEGLDEVYLSMQGIDRIVNIIQGYENELVTPDYE